MSGFKKFLTVLGSLFPITAPFVAVGMVRETRLFSQTRTPLGKALLCVITGLLFPITAPLLAIGAVIATSGTQSRAPKQRYMQQTQYSKVIQQQQPQTQYSKVIQQQQPQTQYSRVIPQPHTHKYAQQQQLEKSFIVNVLGTPKVQQVQQPVQQPVQQQINSTLVPMEQLTTIKTGESFAPKLSPVELTIDQNGANGANGAKFLE